MRTRAFSLRTILIVTITSLIIVLIVSVTILFGVYIRNREYEHAEFYMESTLTSVASDIEYRIVNHVYDEGIRLMNNEALVDFLKYDYSTDYDERALLVEIFKLNKLVGNKTRYQEETVLLTGIANKQDFMYSLHDPYYENSELEKVTAQVFADEGRQKIQAVWYPLQQSPFFVKRGSEAEKEDIREDHVVIMSGNIMNVRSGEYVGKQLYAVKERAIYDIYNNESLIAFSEIGIFDQDGSVISHSNEEKLEAYLSGSLVTEQDEDDVLTFKKQIDNCQWTIVAKVQKENVYSGLGDLFYVNLIIVMFILFGGITTAIAVSRRIVKPFKTMIDSMEKVKYGDFDSIIVEEGTSEVRSLMNYYNLMVREINDNIIVKNELSKKKKKAEMDALFAQINPHFLYNTLESIAWKARKAKDRDLEDMVHYLGRFFSLIVNKGRSHLTVREELEHVQLYMNIQNIRSKGRYDYRVVVVDEAIYVMKTIKLILQPIIENSIIHGFKEYVEKPVIQVTARFKSNAIEFLIEDNGIGMCSDKVNELNKLLSESKAYEYDDLVAGDSIKRTSGIGLINIHQRIKLYYGINYGLRVNHSESGNSISILIPKKHQK